MAAVVHALTRWRLVLVGLEDLRSGLVPDPPKDRARQPAAELSREEEIGRLKDVLSRMLAVRGGETGAGQFTEAADGRTGLAEGFERAAVAVRRRPALHQYGAPPGPGRWPTEGCRSPSCSNVIRAAERHRGGVGFSLTESCP